MKRILLILAIILFCFTVINARAKYSGYVEAGGKSVKTSSISTYLLMETFPSSTVTVYLTGTTTLASIYSNNTGTVKANPFTADSHSYFEFYADNGFYDIKFSGTGISVPWTRSYIALSDPSEEYNPLSFGAKCDNSTTDTSAFASIVTLMGSANGTIKLPKLGPCRIGTTTFPSYVTLDFSSSGGLYILNGNTVAINGKMLGSTSKRFYNTTADSGTGTVSFSASITPPILNPLWWKENTSFSIDMTSAIQAAATATGGRGIVHISCGQYKITDTITTPYLSRITLDNGPPPVYQYFAPVTFEGESSHCSHLINVATANKPTLLLTNDMMKVRDLGFWSGDVTKPNDGIKVQGAGRIYIENNQFFVNGNGIYLEKAQSIWILKNAGSISGFSGAKPSNAVTGWTWGATDAFVYVNLAGDGEYGTQLVIRDNVNEGYPYQVYAPQSGTGFGNAWFIEGNQGESSINGGYFISGVNDFKIDGNYLGEGGGGYTVELENCRNGIVGPNYIHVADSGSTEALDTKMATVKLSNSYSVSVLGAEGRLLVTGLSRAIVVHGGLLDRIQDESTDHQLSLVNVLISNVTVPKGTLNYINGRALWYSDSLDFVYYPTVRAGDTILKTTPAAATSPGWVCVTSADAGTLTQTVGTGPDPVLGGDSSVPDYSNMTAYDFKIIMLSPTTYKVQWKPQGSGVYADLTNTTTITELAHYIKRETGSGPTVSFSLKWPTGVTYATGDTWEITDVVAPVFKTLPALGA